MGSVRGTTRGLAAGGPASLAIVQVGRHVLLVIGSIVPYKGSIAPVACYGVGERGDFTDAVQTTGTRGHAREHDQPGQLADLRRRRGGRDGYRLYPSRLRPGHQPVRYRQRNIAAARPSGWSVAPSRTSGAIPMCWPPRSSFPWATGPNDRGLSRKHIMEQCHASLRRLGVEYIDLYQCHRYDPETPLDETLRALDDLVTQGKVLYLGVSEWRATQIAEAVRTWRAHSIWTASSPISPSTTCCSAILSARCCRSARVKGSARSSSHRWRRACSPANISPDKPPPQGTRATDSDSNMFLRDLLSDRDAGRGAAPPGAGRRGRLFPAAAGAGLGAAPAACQLGDHRRLTPRTGGGERPRRRPHRYPMTWSSASTRRSATWCATSADTYPTCIQHSVVTGSAGILPASSGGAMPCARIRPNTASKVGRCRLHPPIVEM